MNDPRPPSMATPETSVDMGVRPRSRPRASDRILGGPTQSQHSGLNSSAERIAEQYLGFTYDALGGALSVSFGVTIRRARRCCQ